MTPIEKMRDFRRDMVVAGVMVAAGVAVSVMSIAQLNARSPQLMAQATPPLQSTPGAESKPSAPSSETTTGTRPAATPPQPAQPDADAQKAGAAARTAAGARRKDRAAYPDEVNSCLRNRLDCFMSLAHNAAAHAALTRGLP